MLNSKCIIPVLTVLSCFVSCVVVGESLRELEIRMPPHETKEEDTYLCTAVQLPEMPLKLIEVEPDSDQGTILSVPCAMSLGCQSPRNMGQTWECKHQPPCEDQDSVIYGWGRNAEKVRYPEGVAFSVGRGTELLALVLQVHYLTKRPENDRSGVILKLTEESSERTASTTEYAAGFVIPPGKERFPVDTMCCYSGFEPLTTVAFRVHTHEMGRSVYMTKTSGLTPDGAVIARRDPLLPQGFVPVNSSVTIFPGEKLTVTCDFDSQNKTGDIVSGFGHNDEMCNMYMMMYSDIPHFGICNDGLGFHLSQKTGTLDGNALFKLEEEVSHFWQGPDSARSAAIGEVVSVDRGHDGRIWMLHRGDRAMELVPQPDKTLRVVDTSLVSTDAVLVLDPTTGEIQSSWGADFFSLPHMLTIGFDGSVWITDVGKHQVFKFSPEGKLLMTLGEEFTPGKGSSQFCSPTEVAVLTDGSFLVSDGYCNQRVVKFNAQGEFEAEKEDADLILPHSLLVDECKGILYVADREASKVAVYLLSNIARIGTLSLEQCPMALARGPFDTLLALTWDGEHEASIVQVAMDTSEPSILTSWTIPSKDFPHDLTLSAAPVELTGPGNRLFTLYIAEVNGKKLTKLILCPPSFDTEQTFIRSQPPKTPETTQPVPTDNAIQAGHTATKVTILKQQTMQSIVFHPTSQSTHTVPHVHLFLIFCSLIGILIAMYYLKRRSH